MHRLLVVGLALVGAALQALASTLQWDAESDAPAGRSGGFGLALYLVRRPKYLGGIGCLIGSFLFQAAALSQGRLAVVQPLLMCELPLTLLLSAALLGLGLDRREVVGSALLVGGLALLLVSMAPSGGHEQIAGWKWLVATVLAGLFVVALTALARDRSASIRAALLAARAAIGYGLTAALVKSATQRASAGFAGVLTDWHVYAMVAAGLASILLQQGAFKAGPLAAAQPAMTAVDPLVSIALGVGLFGEHLRTGDFVPAELFAEVVICYGIWLLCRSPLVTGRGQLSRAELGEHRPR